MNLTGYEALFFSRIVDNPNELGVYSLFSDIVLEKQPDITLSEYRELVLNTFENISFLLDKEKGDTATNETALSYV
ncbi:Uncharacterised protein [Moraxella caprae]|uniref:Uncharacterized protein n=1 Tax=Moraxella caprae TaxID=90240 RepID=A0A378QEC8_9GAMM|nr:hypothetical protein [Moraxella caprae]STY98624.1 Uncharacterised protein [Moraxella caprae]STZ01600.1 Uncharacterised protein [Moraxella caprae]